MGFRYAGLQGQNANIGFHSLDALLSPTLVPTGRAANNKSITGDVDFAGHRLS